MQKYGKAGWAMNKRESRLLCRLHETFSILQAQMTPARTTRRIVMVEKLIQGDRFPRIELNLTDGSTITLPEQIPGRYLALLFYRGEW